jgi:Flp pilus assembly protein TadD
MTMNTLPKLLLMTVASAVLVSSCTKPKSLKEEELMNEMVENKKILPATAAEREAIRHHDMITQAKFWGDQFDLSPSDLEAATEFATALRAIGSAERAVDVATQALALHPGNVELSKILAKAHMETGRPERATSALYNAQPTSDDWTLYSLYGVALDQMGSHDKAQLRYVKALEISPNNQVVLANYALSLALQGTPEKAEEKLKSAIANNEFVDPRVRQNLALVLGIQGKFDEATEVASTDLPPSLVEANANYYKKLLTPPSRSWTALRKTQSE